MDVLLFDVKIVYSYVIEVADSKSDLGLCNRGLVSEIFAFYHFQENLHFVDQDVMVMYTFYLITPAFILLICDSAPVMDFLRCLCEH